MTYCQSLPPIIDLSSKVLILGSMPGTASLQQQEYYAHPRNQFWPIICEILAEPLPNEYEQRVKQTKAAGIALWDVIASCHRQGSLDKDITQIKPNDLDTLLVAHPSVKMVAFNGTQARQIFQRYNHFESHPEIKYLTMPSTSPANTKPITAKLISWRAISEYL